MDLGASIGRIPIIRLRDVLIVSVQVELEDKIVEQLKDDITTAIDRSRPSGLVIDVTGLGMMDSFISKALRDIGMIAKLMGVEPVLSGVGPAVAMTLVEMDIDMRDIKASLNLEDALAWLHGRAPDRGPESVEVVVEEVRGEELDE